MTRTALFAGVALLIGGVAIFGFNRIPDDAAMSVAEQEAAANDPSVMTEAETQSDETLASNVVNDTPEVDLQVSAPSGTTETAAVLPALTVEGYDAQRVSYILQDSDMPVEVRNDFLAQLNKADDNPDALRAVLRQLRAELAS